MISATWNPRDDQRILTASDYAYAEANTHQRAIAISHP
jgi:hypothetical protein